MLREKNYLSCEVHGHAQACANANESLIAFQHFFFFFFNEQYECSGDEVFQQRCRGECSCLVVDVAKNISFPLKTSDEHCCSMIFHPYLNILVTMPTIEVNRICYWNARSGDLIMEQCYFPPELKNFKKKPALNEFASGLRLSFSANANELAAAFSTEVIFFRVPFNELIFIFFCLNNYIQDKAFFPQDIIITLLVKNVSLYKQ